MRRPLTVRDVAEVLGWEREDAYRFVRVLLAARLATECGIRRPTGSGRGENVYEFADNLESGLRALAGKFKGR